ncbi:MAG: RNB domain-containing ribonuclease, partial [Clostridiales bacterium]|nr:RNB domain-containing ribonuclease [Candidatus Blautia equi]
MGKNQISEKRKKFILELMGDQLYQPMRLRELGSLLRLEKAEKQDLVDVLEELLAEGKISVDAKGRYRKFQGKWSENKKRDHAETRGRKDRDHKKPVSDKNAEVYEGIFIGHPKGFGFVEIEGQDTDIFISPDEVGTALHRDRVKVAVKKTRTDGKRREGRIIEILERGNDEIVGTFERSGEYGFVRSDNPKFNKDIFIPGKYIGKARQGDKVVVVIVDYGENRKNPEGKITEVLGGKNTPGSDILAIVKSFGIPSSFPEKVIRQADRVPNHVLDADREGRMDLTDLLTVTIDGEDAKDLDDAISLTKENGHYFLGVHIADVSNYVQGGSALDREALKRGTSVYLADRVIPMLPEKLSNGICSLNQGVDRLTLSCLMEINEEGQVVNHKIAETVICVNERMSYTVVKNILEG